MALGVAKGRMEKKRLLIIPSWYPLRDDPLRGNFFYEQAKVMADAYDIRVLVGRLDRRSRARRLLNTCRYFAGTTTKPTLIDDDVCAPPEKFCFTYETGLSRFSRTNYELMTTAYRSAFRTLVEEGWVPDLIHAQSVVFGGIAAYVISREFSIPYVITEHNLFVLSNHPSFIRTDIVKSLEHASRVLTVSHDKSRQLLMWNLNIEPEVVYNLVDETVFPLQSALPGSVMRIVSVTAASFLKDNLTLLKALCELRRLGVHWVCDLIGLKGWGEDAEYAKLVQFIDDNGLRDTIQMLDAVERSKMPQSYQNRHVFVLTSIAEGLSVSLLEAMCSGLYVVATRHGGVEEIISDDRFGKIVNIRDYKAIAQAIARFQNGTVTYSPEAVRRRVVQLCGREAFTRRLQGIYDSVLAEPRGKR
jgi:glycosyltransferase involved in cell wall biosynthesis